MAWMNSDIIKLMASLEKIYKELVKLNGKSKRTYRMTQKGIPPKED